MHLEIWTEVPTMGDLVRWHRGHCKGLSRCRLWGSCVLPGEDFFTFARLTQSRAISQSFRVFITFRFLRDIRLFFIFRNSFLYKITASFTMVIKRSPGGPYRWRTVSFEIHCVVPTWNLTAFGDRSQTTVTRPTLRASFEVNLCMI